MTSKGWIIFISIVVLAIGGAVYVSRESKQSLGANVDINAVQQASTESGNVADYSYGTGTKVTLIEYGDYQCPGCSSAAPIMSQLKEKYKDQLTFVFRNKLMSYHQNARAAASFAEAANQQGKYWEMHTKLYENQNLWEGLSAGNERTEYFANLIREIGGDPDKAKSVVESDEIAQKLKYDEALAAKHGVTGTPSFYLNGKDVGSIYTLDGKIVPKGTTNSSGTAAQLAWSSLEDFDKLVLQPAFKEAGLTIE